MRSREEVKGVASFGRRTFEGGPSLTPFWWKTDITTFAPIIMLVVGFAAGFAFAHL